ncbi:MAG: class I SAM-dependent methyltransferase, partial [Candidatus Hydrogenedentota bacterium]
ELVREQGQGVGVDMHPLALSHCRKRGHTRLTRGDVLHLPIPDDSADAVLLMDVLYHQAVPDKVAALAEVCRILKPGGRVLINVPAYQWMRSSHDAAIHTDQRFTKAELRSFAEETGLAVESSRYWNTILFPAVFVVRMLRRNRSDVESDLSGYHSSGLTYMFEQVLALERCVFKRVPAPFGLSIFLVARK